MHVRFGNVTTTEFETLTEVKFSDEDREWLEERRIDSANEDTDEMFHIFKLPLGIYAGYNIFDELVARLRKYDFKKEFYVEKKLKEADTKPTSPELPF